MPIANAAILALALTCRSVDPLAGQALPPRALQLRLSLPATAADGSVSYGFASSAVQTKGGFVVITDGRDNTLHFFRPDGGRATTVGRSGDGPGEFRANWHIGECAADSVYVLDRQQNRVSIFDVKGRYARSFTLDFEPLSMACSRQGVIAISSMPDIRTAPVNGGERLRYRNNIHLLNGRGERLAVLRDVPLGEPRTLGLLTSVSVSGSSVAVATGESALVDVVDQRGAKLRTFSAGIGGRLPTVAQYRAAAEVLSEQLSVEAQRRASVRLMMKQPMPERLPPYSSVVAAGATGFWVIEDFTTDTTIALARYSSDGRLVMRATLPGGARVVSATDSNVIAILQNDQGEQTVNVYRAQ